MAIIKFEGKSVVKIKGQISLTPKVALTVHFNDLHTLYSLLKVANDVTLISLMY